MAGGMCAGGHAWQGACVAGRRAWQEACMEGGMYGRGFVAGGVHGRGHAWHAAPPTDTTRYGQ